MTLTYLIGRSGFQTCLPYSPYLPAKTALEKEQVMAKAPLSPLPIIRDQIEFQTPGLSLAQLEAQGESGE